MVGPNLIRLVSLKELGNLDTGSDVYTGKRMWSGKVGRWTSTSEGERLDRSLPTSPPADSLISFFWPSELPDNTFLFKSTSLLHSL